MPPARKRTGRTPKLEIDPELAGRIMAYVRDGAYPERAAAAAGVHESTHYRWKAKGLDERAHRDAGKPPRKTWQCYLDYLTQLEQADAQAELALLAKATGGGADSIAAMKILERRFRERWARTPPPATRAQLHPVSAVTPLEQIQRRRDARRER